MDDWFKIELIFPVLSVVHQALLIFTFLAQFPLSVHLDIRRQ